MILAVGLHPLVTERLSLFPPSSFHVDEMNRHADILEALIANEIGELVIGRHV
ncbi:MAG: hypothetical protein ACRDL7_00170 [Gaiellaceae bacterium]